MIAKSPIFTWQHKNSIGKIIGKIHRFINLEGKKQDIPYYHEQGEEFKAGIPDELKENGYPLFGLETFKDANRVLIICEGQKAQTAFAGLGFQCVTSILGASNAHRSNWKSIEDADLIYLIPDSDASGDGYAKAIYKLVHVPESSQQIEIVRLPNLPAKGDVCDWLKQQPELQSWNELDTLTHHPARDTLQMRLRQVISENLQAVPEDWKCAISDWPDPEVIQNVLLPVEPLRDCLIPKPYHDWVTDVAERMQCPRDFIATAAIVITASIIGAGCGIKPKKLDDWSVLPNLWGGIIGRPGMLKTPAVAEVMQIISHLETEAKKIYDAKRADYQVEVECHKLEKEAVKSALLNSKKLALKNQSADGSYDGLSLKHKFSQLTEPEKPVWKRYKTNDATIEKLSELMAENPRGLLLYRDELMGLLASWDQDGREADRAFFLEAWNGDGALTTDRIGRGTVHTENLCLSIFGNTQPAKISRYLYHAIRGLDNDGLLQRFQLLIYPDEQKLWSLIDRKPNYEAKQRVVTIIRKLVDMDFVAQGAIKEPQDRFPYFHFDDESQEYFYLWLTELEKEKLRSDDHPILLEHLAKYRSLMPSLALVFHLIDVADGKPNKQIALSSTVLAIGWCNYLEEHARRIYGMAANGARQSAVKLAKKIQEGMVSSPFSLRDVYRKQWGLLEEKEIVQKACDELIELGWLRQENFVSGKGRAKLPIYVINPRIDIKQSKENNFP